MPESLHTTKLQTFYRVEINNQVFTSMMYNRPQRRNSFTVSFYVYVSNTKFFGRIKKFVVVPNVGVFAVIYHLNPICTPAEHFCLESPSLDYAARAFPVEETDSCRLVPVSSLCNKCILMNFSLDSTYIAEMDVDILLD